MDEFQTLVLNNLADIKSELKQHIRDETAELASIKNKINRLEVDAALNKQKLGLFSAGISALVAGLWAAFSTWFGR